MKNSIALKADPCLYAIGGATFICAISYLLYEYSINSSNGIIMLIGFLVLTLFLFYQFLRSHQLEMTDTEIIYKEASKVTRMNRCDICSYRYRYGWSTHKPFYCAEVRSRDRNSSVIFINTKVFNKKGFQNFVQLLKADIRHNAKIRKEENVAHHCKKETHQIVQV